MNKAFFTFFFLLAFASFAQTPNSWTRIADYAGFPRGFTSAFSIDSFAYVGGSGFYQADTFAGDLEPRDFWQYNPYSNQWIQKANFPGQQRYNAVYFTIGSKGYMGLGANDYPSLSLPPLINFWEYDPTLDTWTQKDSFPMNLPQGAQGLAGFSIGNKGYVCFGGIDSSNFILQNFWEYDPTADSWTPKANFPGQGHNWPIGFNIGTKAYVGMEISYDNLIYNRDLWEYDPSTDTWTQKASFPGITRGGIFDFVIGSNAYIGTGLDSLNTYLNDFWEYNSVTDQWIEKDSFGGGNRQGVAGFSIGNIGYAGIGENPNDQYPTDFWMYTPDSIATGITELTNQMQVLFYPNPVEDAGMLQIFIDENTKATISITDQQGREIKEVYSGDITNGNTTFDINTKALTSGLYFLVINSDEGKKTIKFTKL
jgi:N-acetylneuraminic acid mutarotase